MSTRCREVALPPIDILLQFSRTTQQPNGDVVVSPLIQHLSLERHQALLARTQQHADQLVGEARVGVEQHSEGDADGTVVLPLAQLLNHATQLNHLAADVHARLPATPLRQGPGRRPPVARVVADEPLLQRHAVVPRGRLATTRPRLRPTLPHRQPAA